MNRTASKTAAREIGKATLRNVLTLVSLAMIAAGGFILAASPDLALWRDGRLTDLGGYGVVVLLMLGIASLLPWARRFDERNDQ